MKTYNAIREGIRGINEKIWSNDFKDLSKSDRKLINKKYAPEDPLKSGLGQGLNIW